MHLRDEDLLRPQAREQVGQVIGRPDHTVLDTHDRHPVLGQHDAEVVPRSPIEAIGHHSTAQVPSVVEDVANRRTYSFVVHGRTSSKKYR